MYDPRNMQKLERLQQLTPGVFKAFAAFDAAAVGPGALPVKLKELIAIGVAVTTQCPYCIDKHARLAKAAGATEQEIAEAAMVAAAIRAGGAVTHVLHAIE